MAIIPLGFIALISISAGINDLQDKQGAFKHAKIGRGAKFIQADMLNLPFRDNYADYLESIDAIEHLPIRQQPLIFKEFYRVLKSEAVIKVMTTDFSNLAALWLAEVVKKPFDPKTFLDLAEVIYGNQVGEGEFHKCPYTPAFLHFLLKDAGFKHIKIIMYPRFNTDSPNMAGIKMKPGLGWRTDMIYAEAKK